VPAGASHRVVAKGLSQVEAWLAGGRGWAAGTPDALAILEKAGWRAARVRVGERLVRGAYAAQGASVAKMISALPGWQWKLDDPI
jgi:hypothetical protein